MKHVLITGASRRLGLFLSQQFIKKGWFVHALTRSVSKDLKGLEGSTLNIYELGDYNEESISSFLNSFLNTYSNLDAIIHNASIYKEDEELKESGLHFYSALWFIHMALPALLTQGLAKHLEKTQGNIISITDIYTDNPNESYGLYCSTKAGLQNLTLSYAKQFAPKIRANCIQPGPIKFLDEHNSKHQNKVLSETLLAYEGGFDPVFKTVEFILDNGYITGECIKVDGGRSLKRG